MMISLWWLAIGAVAVDDTLGLPQLDLAAPAVAVSEAAAPVRLWLNSSRQYREGERARVQVEANDDGYLLVFNYDTEGRLRVLYPVDPRDDNLIRAGRRYEVQGRGDRESFIVGRDGQGLVYAAVSADPFRLDAIQDGGNWDYTRLYIDEDSRDPEADITELVQRMSSDRGFDYDVLSYRVYGYRDNYRVTSGWWYPRPYGYYDDYNCDPWYRPSLFGCRYYPTGGWYLGGFYGGRGGWGGGYYDDWWWRSRYWGTWAYGNRNYRYPIVAGRPRGYTIVRHNPDGNRARPVLGGTLTGALPRGLGNDPGYRPRDGGRPRPADDRAARPSPDSPRADAPRGVGGESRPRARRSPPPSGERPNIERGPSSVRGPVEIGDGSGRRVRGGDDNSRPAPRYDFPTRSERPRVERPRESPSARAEPRSSPPPRAEPRSSPPPRSEPRSSPPPRAEPRHGSGSGSARPSSGGGGGGSRPASGGGRPRGRPGA